MWYVNLVRIMIKKIQRIPLLLAAIIIFVFTVWSNINYRVSDIQFNPENVFTNITGFPTPKILVIYTYYERNHNHAEALRFFRDLGITERDDIDFLIIIQGYNCSVKLPNYSNVKIFKRPNNCYDFGAIGDAIRFIGGVSKLSLYKFIIFLNSSAFGPILPRYWPKSLHWSQAFISLLSDKIRITSTIINCLPYWSADGKGPRLSGMAFAAYSEFIIKAYQENVFSCYDDKKQVVLLGEYGITKLAMKYKIKFNSFLLKYGDIDWYDPQNWECNNSTEPFKKSRYDEYARMDIHPLETVFYKPIWIYEEKNLSVTFLTETYQYMKWARERAGIVYSE